MKTKTTDKISINEIRHQIETIDERIEKLNNTGKTYLHKHGIRHTGIEKLITALVNERAELSKKILKAQ